MAANLRKRRGAIRGSITRLMGRVAELESTADQPRTADYARQLLERLKGLDSDFKQIHFKIVDLIAEEDEDSLETEQSVLDKLDDDVAALTVRLGALSRTTTTATDEAVGPDRRVFNRKLTRVRAGLNRINEALTPVAIGDTPSPEDALVEVDSTLLSQYREELQDYKRDLAMLYDEIAGMDISDDDELLRTHSTLERLLSTASHKVKRHIIPPPSEGTRVPSLDGKGVKLPKLDIPTFDRSLINWKKFWEQYVVAVHNKTNLSDAEKMVYLQNAIKDGGAKNAIEGLFHSGDNYEQAIDCLKSRYDRPRLIQRTHVQLILDTPVLKEGSGKELRKLHDTVQQHVRALTTLGCDLPGKFITSMIELKPDSDTLFEWQRHSQAEVDVPHYDDLLQFVDLRAQVLEVSCGTTKKQTHTSKKMPGRVVSHATNTVEENCVACKTQKHHLYMCPTFKAMTHEGKREVLKTHRLCTNCLGSGHFKHQCKSIHKCKVCQGKHHTLMHLETTITPPSNEQTSCVTACLSSNVLLMTSRVRVAAPDGSTVEARALIDNASSASFISERLVNSLSLPRVNQSVSVSGVGGLSHKPPLQSITNLQICSIHGNGRRISITAVIVPKVTCDLPLKPVIHDLNWNHLSNLPLADPGFATPGRIDILLGADVFVDILGQGRRDGPAHSPTAFKTDLGWVLCGETGATPTTAQVNVHLVSFHTATTSTDDLLRRFWEIEESPSDQSSLSIEECMVIHYFETNHTRSKDVRFVVPLPKNPHAKPLGESRSQAVRRFFSLERSLKAKGCFRDFDLVMQEYMELGHAEVVPASELEMPLESTFYLPMHAVYKASSTTTKIRAVFDASAKSISGVSLNDELLIGPTIHPPLLDVLMRFRSHPVALTAGVSKMYRAVELAVPDKDLHRFVWRSHPEEPLKDYRMTRVTFGVCILLCS